MPKKKNRKTELAKPEATPQSKSISPVISNEPVRPDTLADIARQEPIRRELSDFGEAITVLRDEKKFTFREIAKWLQGHGIEADHNAVYREYTRGMPDEVAHGEALADEAMERE